MRLRVMDKLKSFPGPRYKNQGRGSGEEFRENHLIPAFNSASSRGEKLYVDMDGAKYGYPTSFLEEAFGGLVRSKGGAHIVRETIVIVCKDEPLLEKEVLHYIDRANQKSTPPFEG